MPEHRNERRRRIERREPAGKIGFGRCNQPPAERASASISAAPRLSAGMRKSRAPPRRASRGAASRASRASAKARDQGRKCGRTDGFGPRQPQPGASFVIAQGPRGGITASPILRLLPAQQAGDVGAMRDEDEEDEDERQQREQGRPEEEKIDRRQRRGNQRRQGRGAERLRDAEPARADQKRDRPRQSEQDADKGGHALAAFEPEPDRERGGRQERRRRQ